MSAAKDFNRTRRLLTPIDFRNTFKQAIKIHSSGISFYLRKNSLARARLGIVVAKKRVKTAVLRNKIKRITREQFRHVQSQLIGWDIIVMVNNKIDKTHLFTLDKLLIEPWQKLKKFYH